MARSTDGPPENIISVRGVTKTYAGGTHALKGVDLDVRKGEILALLGPNGAGKTTLIGIICGTVNSTSGTVTVGGLDHKTHYREVRRRIGLVPQELHTDMFEPVLTSVKFSRDLFGKPKDSAFLEKIMRDLSLWDKRKARIGELSGGMKRRLMIAKALSHEPDILFLDEPTAGVDVELRQGMWQLVREMRERGTTIVLTTHYIEEAEEMADRVGVISAGEMVALDDTAALMKKLGKKTLSLALTSPLSAVPDSLQPFGAELSEDGMTLTYRFSTNTDDTGAPAFLAAVNAAGIGYRDLDTEQSSLEEIFVELVNNKETAK